MINENTVTDRPVIRSTQWLRECKWGVMFHYLASPPSSDDPAVMTPERWNERVNSFDVDGFAEAVRQTGAGYVIFTVGQGSGFYCSPNSAYDEITGIRPSKLSDRDLMAEIADALAPDIRFIAYVPCEAPRHDTEAVERFEMFPTWHAYKWGLPAPENADKITEHERMSKFQRKWERVIREWSLRWGDRVSAWWIDGCYYSDIMYDHDDEPNLCSLSRALRAGNSDAALAFNNGVITPFARIGDEQDYTAGELSVNLRVHDKWKPVDGNIEGMQMHALTYMGDFWGVGEPRFNYDLVEAYTKYITSRGGAMTWDVPIGDKGDISPCYYEQLMRLGKNL